MDAKPGIDRRKHDVDVIEQVMKGVRTQPHEPGRTPHVLDHDFRGWTAGAVVSAVEVQVIDDDRDRR